MKQLPQASRSGSVCWIECRVGPWSDLARKVGAFRQAQGPELVERASADPTPDGIKRTHDQVSSWLRRICLGAGLLAASLPAARADAVTDWNLALEKSLAVPAERGPRVPVRTLAILHAAMFDAVNGIEKKFAALHVTEAAPGGAHPEAAAIQAAYTVLSALRPATQAAWDAQLAASLATLPAPAAEAAARGRDWGATVARALLAWRADDGSATVLPPFTGRTAAGWWRHAPLGASPAAGHAYLVTRPFLLADPLAFDPGPPYGAAGRAAVLAGAAYAADVREVQARGGETSTVRTAAELDEALFLDACDVASMNTLWRSQGRPRSALVDNARAFALLNLAAFDTHVVFFRLKYRHEFWRPFQAINHAATAPDPAWKSCLPTPPHPEYVSAHVALFTAMLQVMTLLQGEAGPVDLTAPASGAYPGGTRRYQTLAAISDATVEARINVGFHFRTTARISQPLGRRIAATVVDGFLRPLP
jgi:hypothetical protein